jgi:hypothetical protein
MVVYAQGGPRALYFQLTGQRLSRPLVGGHAMSKVELVGLIVSAIILASYWVPSHT